MKYMLDTNIISYILNKKEHERVLKIILKKIIEGNNIFINSITYYEIKRGLLKSDAGEKLENFNSLIKNFNIVLFDDIKIFDKASEIYAILAKSGKIINDADILIASLAIYGNFILVSNDKHFKRIQDLKIENWLE